MSIIVIIIIIIIIIILWPRGLRRGSAATRVLGLWVRITLGHRCLL
jgi:hypothetical protein